MKNLIIIIVIVNFLTLLGWTMFQKKVKAKNMEYSTSNSNSDYNYEILITFPWWRIFFMDEFFTPRFKIKIKNLGKDINMGNLECDIIEHDDVSSFPSAKNFKDFQHFRIIDFKYGETRELEAIVKSKFLKPTNYMLRLNMIVWGPTGTPREELMKQLESTQNINLKNVIAQAEQFWKLSNVDPDSVNPNQFKPYAVYDFRLLEVIKVKPTMSTLTVISTIFGITFMGIILSTWKVLKTLF